MKNFAVLVFIILLIFSVISEKFSADQTKSTEDSYSSLTDEYESVALLSTDESVSNSGDSFQPKTADWWDPNRTPSFDGDDQQDSYVEETTSEESSYSSDGDGYTNIDGDYISSPVFTDEAPDGATAECNDGSYSFSQNHRGTCSHHGGVASWL